MKTAKLFFWGMHIHLLLSIVVPLVFVRNAEEGWSSSRIKLFGSYLGVIGLVLVMGLIAIIAAAKLYKQRETERLKEGWSLLKLDTIPFYLLNFVWSAAVWFVIIGASRGLMAFLVPIPILITCAMIAESGVVGIFYLKAMQKAENQEYKPGKIHFLLQLFSTLDILSSIIILWQTDKDELKDKLKRLPLYLFTGLAGGTFLYHSYGSLLRFYKPVAYLGDFSAYPKYLFSGIEEILSAILFLTGIVVSLILLCRKRKERIIEIPKLCSATMAGCIVAVFLWMVIL